MEGADHPDVQRGGLFQQGLHLGAVLAHDVGIVPPGLVHPVPLEVHLVGEENAVQGAEGAEGVGGKEDLVGAVIADHHLRPVDHGGEGKGEGVPAGAQGVPLFDQQSPAGVDAVKLPDQIDGLAVAHHGGLRVAQHQISQRGGVVGLHVVDEHIVQRSAVQRMLQIFKELGLDGAVHGIQQDGFLVQQQIGVIGHPAGNGIGGLKAGQLPVVPPDPHQILCHLAYTIHRQASLSIGRFFLQASYHKFSPKDSAQKKKGENGETYVEKSGGNAYNDGDWPAFAPINLPREGMYLPCTVLTL